MGDPKKLTSKYARPLQMWNKERLIEESKLLKVYGLKNRKEVWKIRSLLRRLQAHAKRLIRLETAQAQKETEQLLQRLERLGLLESNAELNDILSLQPENLLERRLQSIVCRRKLAQSMKQARQLIVHRHITVNEKKITVPSYIVLKNEENTVALSPYSSLSEIEREQTEKKGQQIKAVKKEESESKKGEGEDE